MNVDQGLCQVGIKDGEAIVWDMGDKTYFPLWLEGMQKLGQPYMKAIIISHDDMDHKGGLHLLPRNLDFSGLIIVSPYVDTASLRTFAKHWSPFIYFQVMKQGDTLALFNDVSIQCLWPPFGAETEQWVKENYQKNRMSLCFKVTYSQTALFITSDIDTLAAEKLTQKYQQSLKSDLIVVPHHGSYSSLHPLFYGYVNPDRAIISCGMNNPHNHPSSAVVKFLALQMMISVFDTRFDSPIIGRTNGEYWEWGDGNYE